MKIPGINLKVFLNKGARRKHRESYYNNNRCLIITEVQDAPEFVGIELRAGDMGAACAVTHSLTPTRAPCMV